MSRSFAFVGIFLVGIVATILYFQQQPPAGVETMGDESSTMQWLTLAVAVVSLLTSLVGLVQKLIELRVTRRE